MSVGRSKVPMKDSGIPWIGEIPTHWELKRLRHLGRLQNGISIGGEAFGSGAPFVSYGDVYKNVVLPEEPDAKVQSTADDQKKYSLKVGDVLFTRTSETVDDIGVASTCLAAIPYVTFAGFLIRFRPFRGSLLPRFSSFFFRNQNIQRFFAGSMNIVTRASLGQDTLKSLPVCLPPSDEQHRIADFLDKKTAAIDALIEKNQKLLTLLAEKRAALINQAVTKGLDPNVPMKDSGIPWAGLIPSHWKVNKLKRMGTVRIGLTYAPSDVTASGLLVLRASNVKHGKLVSADDVYVSKDVPTKLLLKRHDILICVRSGSRALVGKSALVGPEHEGATYGAFMSVLRSEANPFIYWALNSMLFPCLMAEFETSTINQLTQSDLRRIAIPVPPPAEQQEIVAAVSAQLGKLDSAVAGIKNQIERLKEYRQALITAAVTGQLDIGEAA